MVSCICMKGPRTPITTNIQDSDIGKMAHYVAPGDDQFFVLLGFTPQDTVKYIWKSNLHPAWDSETAGRRAFRECHWFVPDET